MHLSFFQHGLKLFVASIDTILLIRMKAFYFINVHVLNDVEIKYDDNKAEY